MFDGKAFGEEIVEVLKSHIARVVAPLEQRLAAVEARPMPEKGESGAKGDPGEKGVDGRDGAPGKDGLDGVGLAGAMIDRNGELVVSLSDGSFVQLGQVHGKDGVDGKDGAPGQDGADGFGFDDLSVDYDGARSFAIRFTQGERVKEFPFQMPVMIYRGAWSADECYGQGDTVTWGGSTWHCNAATAAQPDEGVAGWTRQVRRGRDGKNGKDGERGPPGIEGRPGRDLMMEAAR